MKKYIISISLLAVITGILLISCQKEAAHETALQTKSADQLLEERILGFENITLNPTKNGTTMQLDSVLWYSEALLNYSNAEAYEELGAITVFKDTITLQNLPENYTQTDIAILYNQIAETFASNKPLDKFFVFADVELICSNTKNGNEEQVVINRGFGSTELYGFAENDWWEACKIEGTSMNGGRCHGYTGGEGNDASDRIERMANARRGSIAIFGGNIYFTDVDMIESDNYYPELSNSFGFDPYCLFSYEENACLSPTMLEFYTDALATHTDYWAPDNLTLISYDLWPDFSLDDSKYIHQNISTFGIPHSTGASE